MPPHFAKTVRESWSLVMGREADVSAAFYARLFELAPVSAGLFAGTDMIAQRLKFAEMITDIVRHADRPAGLFPDLKTLADRHVEYGVRAADYKTAGDALIHALDLVLGDAFTTEMRWAWTEAYSVTVHVMLRRHLSSGGD
jgi:hemoglobin-like flavoprotein